MKVWIVMLVILTIPSLFFTQLEGIKEIQERGTLRILLVEQDWWPFFYENEQGELAGIDISLAKDIAQALGVEPVFVRDRSFNQLADSLKKGMGDLIISYYSYTPQRNLDLYMSKPYLREEDAILITHALLERARVSSDETDPGIVIDLLNQNAIRIGTIKDTSYVQWARESFPQASLVMLDQNEVFDALSQRKIDAFYFTQYWNQFFLVGHPEFFLTHRFFPLGKVDPISIGVSPNNPSLYHWIDQYVINSVNMNVILEQMYTEYAASIPSLIMDGEKGLIDDPWRVLILLAMIAFSVWFIYIQQKAKRKQMRAAGDQGKPPHWLLNTWTLIFSMVLGLYCGIAFPEIVPFLSPLGDVFFNYLLLVGIPILFFVVFLNFLRLMNNMGGKQFFGKFMLVILVFFFIGSAVGVGTGLWIEPGKAVSTEHRQTLAQAIQSRSGPATELVVDTSPGVMFWMLPKTMIPGNILKAFVENASLAILFFSILLAFSMKMQHPLKQRKIVNGMEILNDAFLFMFRLSYYVMPFGLFSIMLGQAKIMSEDIRIFSAFFLLIGCMFLIVIFWFILSLTIGCVWNKMGPIRYISMIKRPMVIFFSMLSTLATVPAALEVCEKNKALQDENIKGTLPLILVMLAPSITSMFALVTVFLVQLLGIEPGVGGYLFILFGAIGAGLATSGVPGPVYLYAVSIITIPFGIPVQQALFFLLPWTLTGLRLEIVSFTLLDFGVVHFFKAKQQKSRFPSFDNRSP